MKAIEQRLPRDFDKSFIVFREVGKSFPFPWHYHPEFELVQVTSSTGRRMVGDHIGYFEKGDLVFMGSLLPHVWLNDVQYIEGDSTDPAEAIVIQFVDEFLGKDFMSIPEMESFSTVLKLSSRGMVIYGKTREKINFIMRNMLHMNGIKRLSAVISIFDLLSSTSEFELLASPGFTQKSDLKGSDRFSKVTEYIMTNFDRDVSLAEVSAVANMAVTTFCNFFKEHYRVTFVEYLNTVRIGYACKLLAEQNKNVVETAYESGFKNLSNFNRQFKKYKGMTPSNYRKVISLD